MSNKTLEKIKPNESSVILQAILKEVRSLRDDFLFFIPQENLDDYKHANRVKRSYQKALKRYPLTGIWK